MPDIAATRQVVTQAPHRQGRRRIVTVVLLGLSVTLTTALTDPGSPPESATAASRPNIVLITTDDMRAGELRWMPETRRFLKKSGVVVKDFISNHPLCCPARAGIFTGQYGQNNGVRHNDGPYGGYDDLAEPGNHIGAWLKASGYHTAFVGKHMNGWRVSGRRQAGWTVFDPILQGLYKPYGLRMYNNGRPRSYKGIYTADLMGRLSVRYIDRFSASDSPFFIWTSQVPPHHMFAKGRRVPPFPARRHRDLYPTSRPPSLSHPAFNEADVSDKPRWVRRSAKVTRKTVVAWHRARIRSLRSVDVQVKAIVAALRANGELENTYIFFTSDNGYLLGEHRQRRKNKPYEPTLRVPLLVRGPDVPPGTVREATYGIVDLAPTFLELSGARAQRRLDGRSMLGTLTRGAPGYRHYLIQGGTPAGPWWWRGVRSRKWVYIRYRSGFEELYDRAADPGQLKNVARREPYRQVRADLARRLAKLSECAGQTCRDGGSPNA